MTQHAPPAAHLVNATDQLYRAFASARRAPQMRACSHCVSEEMTRDLCARPRHELTETDMGRYAFKAITTWGDEADYQYFFPRILELCNAGRCGEPGLEPWLMRGKLELARWRSWPAPQLEAIEDYLDAIFHHVLTVEPTAHSAAYALQELSHLKLDVRPWLNAWKRLDSPSALQQLAETVRSSWEHIARTGLAFGWPNDAPPSVSENAAALAVWLRAPCQRERLEDAFERYGDRDWGAQLAEAIDAYQWL